MASELGDAGGTTSAIPHFAFVERGTLPDLVGRGRTRRFPKGTVVMRQGDHADFMYLIRSGSVRVDRIVPSLAKPLHLADLGPGQVVGEIGILNRTPRNATVTALTDVLTVQLSREETLRALTEVPGLPESLLQLVTKRLSQTDDLAERIATTSPAYERRWTRQFRIPWPYRLTVTLATHVIRTGKPRAQQAERRGNLPLVAATG